MSLLSAARHWLRTAAKLPFFGTQSMSAYGAEWTSLDLPQADIGPACALADPTALLASRLQQPGGELSREVGFRGILLVVKVSR